MIQMEPAPLFVWYHPGVIGSFGWLACCGVQHMLNIDGTGSLCPRQSLASTQPYGPAVSSFASPSDPNAGILALEFED